MPVVTRSQARNALTGACQHPGQPAPGITSVQPLGEPRLLTWAAACPAVWPTLGRDETAVANPGLRVGYKWMAYDEVTGEFSTPLRGMPVQLNRGYQFERAEVDACGMHFFETVQECLNYIAPAEPGDCVAEVVVAGPYAKEHPGPGCYQKCVAANVWITDRVYDVHQQRELVLAQ